MRKAILSKLEIYLVPALVIAFFLLLTGCYYDASDDAVIALLLRGEIGGATVNTFPRFYFFIAPTLSFLYESFPAIPWLGFFFLLMNYLIGVGVLSVLHQWISSRDKKTIYFIYIIFFFLVLSENYMYFNMNRVAILATGIGIVMASLSRDYRLGWVLIILGMLVRPYGGLLSFSFLLPVLVLIQGKRNYVGLMFMTLAFAGLYLGLTKGMNTFSEEQMARNKLKSNVLDYRFSSGKKMTTKDSLLLEAVHQGYYQDKAITNEFLKEYSGGSRWDISNISITKLGLFFKAFWWSVSRNYQLLILLNIALLFYLKNKRAWWGTFWFWLLILTIGVCLKMPEKILSPALALWSLIGLYFMRKKAHLLPIWLKAMVVVFVLLYTVKLVHRVSGSRQIQKAHEEEIALINRVCKEKVLYMTKFNYVLNYLNPLSNYHYDLDGLVTLTGWPTIIPEYPKTLVITCKGKSFADLFKCQNSKEDIVILFHEKDGAPFLKKYLKQIHQIDVNFISLELKKLPETTTPFKLYELEYVISRQD